jgi:hypothetical protein
MKFALWIFLTLFLLSVAGFADEKFDRRLEKLVVRAKVLEAKLDRSDEYYPYCDLKLEVTFTNEGKVPIIVLRPVEDFDGFRDFIFSSGVTI